MPLNRTHVKADGNPAPQRNRDAASRLSQPPLELVRSTGDGEYLTGRGRAAVSVCHPLAAGQLVVRWERRHDASILWLSGALDQATASLVDREINARAIRLTRLVVDVTGLDFVDSAGLDSLARIQRRVCEREVRLSFRHGPHVVERPLDLARPVQLRSRRGPRPVGESAGDEDFYFALAMACVDVDHPRSGDRPGAA